MSLVKTISVKTEQAYLIAQFMKTVTDTAIENQANVLPTIAGKKISRVRARLQATLADKFLKSVGFSHYHGFVNDLTRYIQDRIDVIVRSEQKIFDMNELNNMFERHDKGQHPHRCVFTIDGIRSWFVADAGYNGVLIYQISRTGNIHTAGLAGYIEDIFQVDWDVSNPTNMDSWLSLVRDRTIPTKYTLVSYLNEQSLNVKDHLVEYHHFEKHFCREIMRRGLLDLGETVRYALGMRNEFIGIHPDSLSRYNTGLNNFLDNMSYSEIGKLFSIGQIYEAIEFLLKENAPVMTEAAFFEQWEHREQFERLDAIIVGLRENLISYVYKVKDTSHYLWVDIINKRHIAKVNILRDKDCCYLGLPFTDIDSVEVTTFLEQHLFAVETEYDKSEEVAEV